MDILDEVIKAYGGVQAVQKRFNYASDKGVYHWRRRGIPKKFAYDIHEEKGIPLKRLLNSK